MMIRRVTVRVNDARAFLLKATIFFDMVIVWVLDSQALFTCMNNIRLDGFIDTVEKFRTAYSLLNEGGLLSVSFLAGQESLAFKLYNMVETATGKARQTITAISRLFLSAPRRQAAPPGARWRAELNHPELDPDGSGH